MFKAYGMKKRQRGDALPKPTDGLVDAIHAQLRIYQAHREYYCSGQSGDSVEPPMLVKSTLSALAFQVYQCDINTLATSNLLEPMAKAVRDLYVIYRGFDKFSQHTNRLRDLFITLDNSINDEPLEPLHPTINRRRLGANP